MTKLNLGQDWSMSADAPNNRLIVEYEPNGTQFELNEDGSLQPLSGDALNQAGNTLIDASGAPVQDVNGQTGSVSVTNPITKIDEAETFAESDVTTTVSDTEIVSESIELGRVAGTQEITINGSFNNMSEAGVVFNPNTADASAVEVVVSEQWGAGALGAIDTFRIEDLSDGTLLVNDSVNPSAGETITRTGLSLSTGQDYAVYFQGTDMDNVRWDSAITFDSTTVVDFIAGWDDGSQTAGEAWSFDSVSVLGAESTSGSATIEWTQPNYINSWDIAIFQRTLDGETVTVNVEESTDGGSTWTEIQTDISRGDEITASADSEVRFRIDLSRTNTANNPTIDSIYRRYEV